MVRKPDLAGSLEGGSARELRATAAAWDEHRGFGFIKPDEAARGHSCTPKASSVPAASAAAASEFESVFDSVRGNTG